MADQTIAQLAEELMRREMATNPGQFKTSKKPVDFQDNAMVPIDADTLGTIGGLADAASTYYFLKRGTGSETNALIKGTNNHPEATALAALGGLAASKGVTALLRKFNPKLAEAVAANLGNLQTQYAISNMGLKSLPRGSGGSSGEYQRKMTALAMRGNDR